MSNQKLLSRIFPAFIKKIFKVEELSNTNLEIPQKILVVRQHNQFGDLLASIALFRALKDTYPASHLTVIVSPENYYAVTKNMFIDKCFVFDKKKVLNPKYLYHFIKLIRNNYDLAIVPVTVAISFTSNFIARLSKSKVRIGPKSLDGIQNKYDYFFNYRVDLDWRKKPDTNVADFGLDIVRPFGIDTANLKSHIACDERDVNIATSFIDELNLKREEKLIGLHIGAGKPLNRWQVKNFVELIKLIDSNYNANFYITGSNSDDKEIEELKLNLNTPIGYFINKSIPQLAALISKSDLFITNDTGVMHVAGATDTPQVSIFGPTNPNNWAPIGNDKYTIRKSNNINDILVNNVFSICKKILDN